MSRTAIVGLQTTIADLQEVSCRLKGLLPTIAEGSLREDLQQMQQQADAAVRYYSSLLPPSNPTSAPAIAQRAAEAAVVPIGGVGLSVPGFSTD